MAPTNSSQKRSHEQFSNDLYDASLPPNHSASEDADVRHARRTLARSIVAMFRRDTIEKLLIEVALENPATMKAIIAMNTQNLTNKLLTDNTPQEPSAQGGTGEELQGPESSGNQSRSNIVQPQPDLLSASNSTSKTSAIRSPNAARPSLNASKNQNLNVVSMEQSAVHGDESVETPAPISNTLNRTAAQTSSQTEEEGTSKSAKKLANVKKASRGSQILLFDEVRVKVEEILSKLPSAYGTSKRSRFMTQEATVIAIIKNDMCTRVRQDSSFGTKFNALRACQKFCAVLLKNFKMARPEIIDMLERIAAFVKRIAHGMSDDEKRLVILEQMWWKSMLGIRDVTVGPEQFKILNSMLYVFYYSPGQSNSRVLYAGFPGN